MVPDIQRTSPSLLIQIRDFDDREAWEKFSGIYKPLIQGYCQFFGVRPADAEDLTQDILNIVLKNINTFEYDPKKGHFRGWLKRIAKNKAINHLSLRARFIDGSGRSTVHLAIENTPDHNTSHEDFEWDKAYRKRLFEWASEYVRSEVSEQTWKAFWLTAMDGQAAEEVGTLLNMSSGSVYSARCRVLARLKKYICEVVDEWPI